jgi:queuine tRNA-ribosyltransferase
MNESGACLQHLDVPYGRIRFPAFFPDATFGFVRALDSTDLMSCRVEGLVMNVFHLMQHPGSSVIKSLGGLHAMAQWDRPIVTDSGGFQAYSLLRNNPQAGSVTKKGILFRPEGSERGFLLTPEKSIQLQLSYGADIVICLDYCTHPDDPASVQESSVAITIEWAKRCRQEFDRQVKGPSGRTRPLLFAVVQGGRNRYLRQSCTESLLDIGFDGFGYGGYPFDSEGTLLVDTLKYLRELVPAKLPLFALGVGSPESLVEGVRAGYSLFDCALPTRDARSGRLYRFETDDLIQPSGRWYSKVYIGDKKHLKNKEPVAPSCDCPTCREYSRAYLHHLFKRNDPSFHRLATIHNVRFMTQLIERLRGRPRGV